MDYIDARKEIYVPAYNWMLEHHCWNLVLRIKEMCVEGVVVLLDYDTNTDIENASKPLSHASLIIKAVERLLTDEEKAAWPKQMQDLKTRVKEEAKKREARKSRWQEMKLAAAVKGNPSKYNPIWVWDQQKAKKKLDFSAAISSVAFSTSSKVASVFGGNTSKERLKSVLRTVSSILIVLRPLCCTCIHLR